MQTWHWDVQVFTTTITMNIYQTFFTHQNSQMQQAMQEQGKD